MKRLIAILMACILLFSAASALADYAVNTAALSGYWYGTFTNKETVIELKTNSFLDFTTGDQVIKGSWFIEGSDLHIRLEGQDEMVFEYTGETGYFVEKTTGVILSRNSVSSLDIPEILNVTDIYKFNGKWVPHTIYIYGSVMSAEGYLAVMNTVGNYSYKEKTDLMMTINNGRVKIFKKGKAKTCELSDGHLVYEYDPEPIYDENGKKIGEDVPTIKIYMTADHTLVYRNEDSLILFEEYAK